MISEPYLPRLTARLAAGLQRVPAEERERHTRYLTECQQADGGWTGREGGSDLYYTSFALRGLAVLEALDDTILAGAARYLRASLGRGAAPVDFFSLLYACLIVQAAGGEDVLSDSPPGWVERVANILESFRARDGGYAKMPGGVSGSTYTTFLIALSYEVLGRGLPQPELAREFILSRRREDGGFVEISQMKRAGTNPTAAAIGLLSLTGGVPDDVREATTEFLAAMPSDEGGLRANDRVPLADLLSTFTGAWTLGELGALDRLDADRVLDYADEVKHPPGGFFGGLWDERHDVEYTFYGLGVLGLFHGR